MNIKVGDRVKSGWDGKLGIVVGFKKGVGGKKANAVVKWEPSESEVHISHLEKVNK